MRIRIRYSVNGKIRFISHLDLMRTFFRACARKGIPVAMSQGFSPHPKISFGPPRSVGMSSNDEYLDICLDKPSDIDIKSVLGETLPEGIEILDVFEAPPTASEPSLCARLNRAVYMIKLPDNDGEFTADAPLGIKIWDIINEIWPHLGPDELKLCKIHREKLYNERDID